MTVNVNELFPLVDESGNVIGSATRRSCHSGAKLLHPVVHLHVFDKDGNLFLQKRAENKDIQPGKWDTSVGGHIDYGETEEYALRREAREELGLSEISPVKLYDYIFESDIERELVHAYYSINSLSEIKIDSQELSGGRFFEMQEIEKLIGQNFFTPNFELEFSKIRDFFSSEKPF